MKTKNERIFYYDFLRTFAIIAVIICHVDFFFGSLTTNTQIIAQMTFHDIGRIGVPIFLMISGALLLNREYDLKDFLKRRFARIIYPFIFWIIIILTQLHFMHYNSQFIWNTFIGNHSITWYFWTLIGIYLFIPIINTFIEKYGNPGCKYFLAIWFITIILKTINLYPIFPYFTLDYFAYYIGYPVLGYYLNNEKFNLSDEKICISGFILLILSITIFVYLDYNNINFISEIYLNVPMVLMVSGMFIFIKYLDKITSFKHIKDNIIGKGIVSISLCSYGMYFSHVIVLKILTPYNPKSTLMFPLMFTLTIFISWLLPYILSKIPYIKIISGA